MSGKGKEETGSGRDGTGRRGREGEERGADTAEGEGRVGGCFERRKEKKVKKV